MLACLFDLLTYKIAHHNHSKQMFCQLKTLSLRPKQQVMIRMQWGSFLRILIATGRDVYVYRFFQMPLVRVFAPFATFCWNMTICNFLSKYAYQSARIVRARFLNCNKCDVALNNKLFILVK